MFKVIFFAALITVAVASAKHLDEANTVTHVVQHFTGPFEPAVNAIMINRNERIVNGSNALDTQFPHVNEVLFFVNATNYFYCTGTFISTTWTITAQHCLPEIIVGVYVEYGTAATDSPNRLTARSDQSVYWTNPELVYDVMIVHLMTPITLSPFVQIAQLPPLSMVNYNYGLHIAVNAGFGALRQTLQWHTLLMLGNNCGNDPTAELFICAATTSPATQNEGGDSGGSYFIYENGPISGTPTIIGIHYGRAVWTNGTITNLATRIGPFMGLVSAQAGITLRP